MLGPIGKSVESSDIFPHFHLQKINVLEAKPGHAQTIFRDLPAFRTTCGPLVDALEKVQAIRLDSSGPVKIMDIIEFWPWLVSNFHTHPGTLRLPHVQSTSPSVKIGEEKRICQSVNLPQGEGSTGLREGRPARRKEGRRKLQRKNRRRSERERERETARERERNATNAHLLYSLFTTAEGD